MLVGQALVLLQPGTLGVEGAHHALAQLLQQLREKHPLYLHAHLGKIPGLIDFPPIFPSQAIEWT